MSHAGYTISAVLQGMISSCSCSLVVFTFSTNAKVWLSLLVNIPELFLQGYPILIHDRHCELPKLQYGMVESRIAP